MEIISCTFLMEHGSNLKTQWSHEEKQDQMHAAFDTAEEDVSAL